MLMIRGEVSVGRKGDGVYHPPEQNNAFSKWDKAISSYVYLRERSADRIVVRNPALGSAFPMTTARTASSLPFVAIPGSAEKPADLAPAPQELYSEAKGEGIWVRLVQSLKGPLTRKSRRDSCDWCGSTDYFDAVLETCVHCEAF